ncbi:MAG TPA: histone deacetylase [Deltaproteobacteria bacterium]|nr:histone deacetylase [Deltaproteobacteria bacterium]
MIGIVSDPVFMDHDTGCYHPESSLRIQYIHTLFYQKNPGIKMIDPVIARVDDIALNHDMSYVRKIAGCCRTHDLVNLDMDTVCCEDSYNIALLAAGSLIRLTEMALNQEIDAGFAFVRPPGHHALKARAMGFCIFNNVAIAARNALKYQGIKRVMIVDFDVHHGNGTQDSFYNDKSVLYFSTHQYPFYPGTGGVSDTGRGKGLGYTVNCPLSAGKRDGHFIAVYRYILAPVVQAYEPELILVSAGFDAHAMDPIGGMDLSSKGFGAIAGIIRDAACHVSAPIIFALEGGYNLNALKDSVACVVDIMKGQASPEIQPVSGQELDTMIETHGRFWPLVRQ